MNVLFLTLCHIENLSNRGIYEDLLREFSKHKHNVYVISPIEKRFNSKTTMHVDENVQILELRTGNIQKTNIFEKGISTLLIEHQFISAIKKYFSGVKFDLILYTTPPITFVGAVKFVKKRDNAKTYLLLKDIFPQNSVDLGMLAKTGVKGIIYKYFRKKEKKLYAVSDRIGCMSQANVDYVLKHNLELSAEKVGVSPNCIDAQDFHLSKQEYKEMREKYGIPQDKKVFVYGGNLGKPQCVPFIVDCLKACRNLTNTFFVISGSGTQRHLLEEYIRDEQPSHVKLLEQMPKDEYDRMIACCDVGLIFLDYRFTIPNFPSRLLSYMQAGLPVLACTDPNTDIGKVIVEGEFGWWCGSNSAEKFSELVSNINDKELEKNNNATSYLLTHYSSYFAYKEII